jgi:hypothetical protein
MSFLDILIYPIYVAIFYYLFSLRRKRYTDPILQHYHKIGFWIKAFSAIAFTVFNYYISWGDSAGLYFTEGVNIYKLILKDSEHVKWIFMPGIEFDQTLLQNSLNQGYFRAENNYMVARVVTIFAFFCFGKYSIINLCFSMLAYIGVWRLFRFFYSQFPHLHKQLAISILYLPTFVFWASGILKDPLCICCLGLITYSLYDALYNRKNIIINAVIILAAGYMLSILKIYILVSYLPFFFLFLLLKNIELIKNRFLKIMIVIGLIGGSMVMFTGIVSKLTETLGDYTGEGGITGGVAKFQNSYRESASSFSLGVEFDGSLTSLAKVAPAAVVATFYRPFLWESRSVSTLLSSFESLFFIFFTLGVLKKYGLKHFISSCRKEPIVIYCLLFSLLFALFVGATTRNFGSLVRYKIPCMPFYLIAFYVIQDRGKKNSPKVIEAVTS